MGDDGWLIAKQAEIFAIVCEVMGMQAANAERIHRGEALAYNETAFNEKAESLRYLSDNIMVNR